jgi:hypothetical protein
MKEENNEREIRDVNFKYSCLIRGELPGDLVGEISSEVYFFFNESGTFD